MILRFLILFSVSTILIILAKEQMVQTKVNLNKKKQQQEHSKISEDNIPMIEIKGEGKPMSAAQIRALEEEVEGKPLDIKVKKTWVPKKCPHKAQRLDFVTFHYKGFFEDNRKFGQTYGKEPVTIQLGVGMTMPGLDKGLRGICDSELRRITIPWRLNRRRKSRVWRNVPKEEHWISIDVEMFLVEPWTPKRQFEQFDLNNDKFLTASELTKFAEKMRKDYGKIWLNEDIDTVLASKYFVKYFDSNGDEKIDLQEYEKKMSDDLALMKAWSRTGGKKPKGRLRDPGLAWILDFDNDGTVSAEELDAAPELLAQEPQSVVANWSSRHSGSKNTSKTDKTEL